MSPSALGLALLVVPAALIFGGLGVDWGAAAGQLVLPRFEKQDVAVYLITAIAVLGAGMSPYEWYFYSSGGREEEWTARDLGVNRVTAIAGFSLGSILAFSLLIGAATIFFPRNISPAHLFQAGLIPSTAFGKWGMALFLVGAFGCGAGRVDRGVVGHRAGHRPVLRPPLGLVPTAARGTGVHARLRLAGARGAHHPVSPASTRSRSP